MMIDHSFQIYKIGRCEGIRDQSFDDEKDELAKQFSNWIFYKVLQTIPIFIFSSYIITTMLYRGISLFIYNFNSWKYSNSNSKKDLFKLITDVSEESDCMYSISDFYYVNRLLNKKPVELGENEQQNLNDDEAADIFSKSDRIKLKKTFLKYFKKFVYNFEKEFRFSARFINAILTASMVLYYISITFFYYINLFMNMVFGLLDKVSDLFCTNLEMLCPSGSDDLNGNQIQIFDFNLKSSFRAVMIVPIIVTTLICYIQLFFGVKELKIHLSEIYKGICEYVPKKKTFSNGSIARGSFHFTGYLVGYLVWGYLIIYLSLVFIGIIILILRIFIGKIIYLKIFLTILPFLVAIILKTTITIICTKYIFLVPNSKILALKNTKAFNIFLFFNFFYDCFMGIASAIFRIILSTVIAIIMMPRIGYGFLGRKLETLDPGLHILHMKE